MITYSYKLSSVPGFMHLIKGDNAETSILKLNRMECRSSNNASYSIVRYDKNLLAADLVHTYGLCRSVIVNSNNDVIGFSPPKSINRKILFNIIILILKTLLLKNLLKEL